MDEPFVEFGKPNRTIGQCLICISNQEIKSAKDIVIAIYFFIWYQILKILQIPTEFVIKPPVNVSYMQIEIL